MGMKKSFGFQCISAAGLLLIAAAVFLGLGFFEAAQATSATLDSNCYYNKLDLHGFTTGLVYCVETSVGNAVTLYAGILQTKLRPYEGMALVVAIAVFGIKMMNSNMKDPLKESATLMFRIILGVFFYQEAVLIYTDLAGSGGIINEAIGWVTGLTNSSGGSGSGNNIFSHIVAANCTVPSSPHYYEGQQIWQAFDCMFSKIFGAANPAKSPHAFFTSMLVIVGAALFSSTLGVIVAGLGLSLFIGVLLFVTRALFLVLMSYVCIGFMAIFAPLIAPLIFFESQYLTEKFKQWGGVIIAAIFQPVFVVGFLGLTITVDDMLIEGTLSGCHAPTYPTSSATLASSPALGFGQDGTGVCSFTQLVDNGQSGAALQTFFNNFMQQDHTFFTMGVNGDPQGNQLGDNTLVDPVNDKNHGLAVVKTAVINQVHQLATGDANFEAGGTRLKKFFPMKQFLLTMLTFIMVNFAMKGLMEKVPQIAASMTIAAGINLMAQMQVPFEDTVKNFLDGADGAMMKAAQGKGLAFLKKDGISGFGKALWDGTLAGARNVISKN